MNCVRCGTSNPPGATSCSACGQRLSGAMGAEKPRQGLAITSLVLGVLSIPTCGLLLVGAILGLVLGIVALVKAGRQPALYGGKGLAIAGIVLSGLSLLVMPIGAAIAIPSLLRARISANESAAIGDVRSVISGEIAYQSANGGQFDKLECLASPNTCIPGYTGPSFLDATLLAPHKTGYQRRFYPGPSAAPRPGTSPSSVSSFAYVAVPMQPNQTGVRSFCGDATGRLCIVTGPAAIDASQGVCPASCPTMR
jgi:type IV pilus assembly protein PilA